MGDHLTSSPSQVLSPASSQAVMEKYSPKNILITGGAGFIASHVAIRLTKLYGCYKVGVSAAAATSPPQAGGAGGSCAGASGRAGGAGGRAGRRAGAGPRPPPRYGPLTEAARARRLWCWTSWTTARPRTT